jgi:hypothetical protein
MVTGLGGPSDDNEVGVLGPGDLEKFVSGVALSVDEQDGKVGVSGALLDSAPQMLGMVGVPPVVGDRDHDHPCQGRRSGGGIYHGSRTDENGYEPAAEAPPFSTGPPEGVPGGV